MHPKILLFFGTPENVLLILGSPNIPILEGLVWLDPWCDGPINYQSIQALSRKSRTPGNIREI